MWINIKTGYSFKQVYGHLDKIAEKCKLLCFDAGIKEPYGGIADLGNTFAHIPWKKACGKAGIKPIYGVQLPVVEILQKGERRYPYNWMTFIAKNTSGLQEIYGLVDLSFQQFYYRQRITYDQVDLTTDNIFVLSGVAPRWDLINRRVYKELSPCVPFSQSTTSPEGFCVACVDNYYVDANDKDIYEPFADKRLLERKTSPMHILSKEEWFDSVVKHPHPFLYLKNIAKACNVNLPKAPMVKYIGKDNIEAWCFSEAKKKGINLATGKHAERYRREIGLIREKEYTDYFLVVADAIRYAKTKMAVGPSRGSSAGSLVCYLMGITEIDPLEYGLFFERFIDMNRSDLPDIDIDFQDDKRHLVIKYLEKKYGKKNVAQIANINRLRPKSAINKFSDSLKIPLEDLKELKNAIPERPSGDKRANLCIADTFSDIEIGQKIIEEYPNLEPVKHIENHPSHMGIHAAGILVCNKPITNYCGINSRDNKRIGMLDKKDAEEINLLKIDALGLRTLTIFADVCDQIKKPYSWLYEIPLDDSETYNIFNSHRFNGIFQFEGNTIQKFAKQTNIKSIEDISDICAIGRPGPLEAGSAYRYIKNKSSLKFSFLNDHPLYVDITKDTYGVIIYQEQVMRIVKEIGCFTWGQTTKIRKAISKSFGGELFEEMFSFFKKGAVGNAFTIKEATSIWEHVNTMGGYAFNKSHSVSYAFISYLCAYFKAHYPNEFLVACLNNSNDDRASLKILRDAVENDGVNYCHFSAKFSKEKWCAHDGVLYGGFSTLDGLGPKKAKQAIQLREQKKKPPPGMLKIIKNGISPFKYLYPSKEIYGDYYADHKTHNLNRPVSTISQIDKDGTFTIIGCLLKKKLRDANEAIHVSKRDGKFIEGQTSWLNIVLEDDTGSIMCKIGVKDYARFGKEISETGKEEKDWYMVHGDKVNGWGIVFVKNIKKITRGFDEIHG